MVFLTLIARASVNAVTKPIRNAYVIGVGMTKVLLFFVCLNEIYILRFCLKRLDTKSREICNNGD